DIDGWYADIKEQASCGASLPPIRQEGTCADHVVLVRKGTGKAGYPLVQTITMHNDDATTTKINISTSDIEKKSLGAELFDVPATYHEVKSISELYSIPAAGQSPINAMSSGPQFGGTNGQSMMAQAQQMAPMQQGMSSQFQGGMPGMQGMGMPGAPSGGGIPLPQALGPKAPGRIRIGIAPA